MKKIDNIVRIVLISWGIILLFIVMWLGNKYPEIQQDLLMMVRVYIGLVAVFVISRIIFRIVKKKK
jgi:L-cystine uptake protein TcyP (sodium:dicarboxylate symporter family)